jgi:hypothetical protein
LSNAVRKEQYAMEVDRARYNQALTAGHSITVDADTDAQLKEAKKLAAKRAASLPRSGNVTIGSYGSGEQPTASDGLNLDPVTAVKIAEFHTWEGLAPGASTAAISAQPTLAPTQTAPSAKSAGDLVPGKDFPFIEITDEMAPAEVRKARIANAKAKSAAIKALKSAAPAAAAAAPEQVAAVPETPVVPAAAVATPVVTGEPVAGVDYEVIEITDGMDPADIRKARIANAKSKSAAFKAYKASGGGQNQAPAAVASNPVEATVETQVAEVQTEEISAAPSAALPTDIAAPEYVEITDDMDPSDIRTARIQNAKARSAYVKQLKAAGIDPSTLDI